MDANDIRFDVTVVLTAHSEGRLAHRSVQSVLRAQKFAEQHGVSIEIVAVVDNGTQETIEYFERYSKYFNKICYVDYNDPSLTRNHGIQNSQGDYISLLDADDLFSENWLLDAYQFAQKLGGSRNVLRPHCTVFFEAEYYISWQTDTTSPGFSPLSMMLENYWTIACFAHRDIFIQIPFENSKIWGFEDWHWNCELLASEISIRIVPETSFFVRLKHAGSRYNECKSLRLICAPTSLFTREFVCEKYENSDVKHINEKDVSSKSRIPLDTLNFKESSISIKSDKKALRQVLKYLRICYRATIKRLIRNPVRMSMAIGYIQHAVAALKGEIPIPISVVEESVYNANNISNTPEWLFNDFRRINSIDPGVANNGSILWARHVYHNPLEDIASVYPCLLAAWPENTTHVILLPWLLRGGADLEALHYIEVLAGNSSNQVLVIITEETREPNWLDRLPKNVALMNFGDETAGLKESTQEELLTRLIIQEQPKVIHNLNSRLAYNMIVNRGKAISYNTSIFVSVFCPEIDIDGMQVGYPFEYLPSCIDYLSKVFTDSQWFIDHLVNIYDYDRSKFAVHYMPPDKNLDNIPAHVRIRKPNDRMNILWASRLDRQKRPDMLIEIIKKCSGLPVIFHIYGGSLNPVDQELINIMQALPNVYYGGPFNGFDSLPTDQMDAFLYTSEWDGLPNVILEATVAGLPIISPPTGGVPEVLRDGAGFLVASPNDLDGYVGAILTLLNNPLIGIKAVKKAQSVVSYRHSWDGFSNTVMSIPGYYQ